MLTFPTLEEEWERIKKMEEKGIDLFHPYKSEESCKDCSNCISVCEKRYGMDLTVKTQQNKSFTL